MTDTLSAFIADYLSYYKAIFARTLFGCHALVAVWRTTVLMGRPYWGLAFGVVILVFEYIITMWVRVGEEWPWISPSTLCYLASTASSLWVQKLENLGHIQNLNDSTLATLPSTGMKLDFSAPDWLLLTEQTMVVTIILSRWLLPKGNMAHTELSSLLLLYLGLSADILDFSTIFNETKVAADEIFCYFILIIWTGSLCQFILVFSATSEEEKDTVNLKNIVCSTEVIQILVQVLLQDGPFLLVRVIALLNYQVFNYTIIFFVCKNSLVISIELYHLVALCKTRKRELKKRQLRMKALKNKMVAVKDTLKLTKRSPFNMARLSTLAKSKKPSDATGQQCSPNGSDEQSSQGEPETNRSTDGTVRDGKKELLLGEKLRKDTKTGPTDWKMKMLATKPKSDSTNISGVSSTDNTANDIGKQEAAPNLGFALSGKESKKRSPSPAFPGGRDGLNDADTAHLVANSPAPLSTSIPDAGKHLATLNNKKKQIPSADSSVKPARRSFQEQSSFSTINTSISRGSPTENVQPWGWSQIGQDIF